MRLWLCSYVKVTNSPSPFSARTLFKRLNGTFFYKKFIYESCLKKSYWSIFKKKLRVNCILGHLFYHCFNLDQVQSNLFTLDHLYLHVVSFWGTLPPSTPLIFSLAYLNYMSHSFSSSADASLSQVPLLYSTSSWSLTSQQPGRSIFFPSAWRWRRWSFGTSTDDHLLVCSWWFL